MNAADHAAEEFGKLLFRARVAATLLPLETESAQLPSACEAVEDGAEASAEVRLP